MRRTNSSGSAPSWAATMRALRLRLGIPQGTLAMRVMIPQPDLSAIERGRINPTAGEVQAIGVALARELQARPMDAFTGPLAEAVDDGTIQED